MAKQSEKTIHGVNRKHIFFILLAILLIPSIYFIAQSYLQLNNILSNINTVPALSTSSLLSGSLDTTDLKAYKVKARVSLENDVIVYRHQRTTAFLSTRTWMRFMSLMFGAILIVIGSGFVLGKITDSSFTSEFSFKEFGASIATSSPGLLLVICGVILIAIPNLSNQRIDTDDTSSYISKDAGTESASNEQVNAAISDIRKKYNLGSGVGK